MSYNQPVKLYEVLHFYKGSPVLFYKTGTDELVNEGLLQFFSKGENGIHIVGFKNKFGQVVSDWAFDEKITMVLVARSLSSMSFDDYLQFFGNDNMSVELIEKNIQLLSGSLAEFHHLLQMCSDWGTIPRMIEKGYWLFGDQHFSDGVLDIQRTEYYKPEQLTAEKLKGYLPGQIFACGVDKQQLIGQDESLRWLAVLGQGHFDWAIYYGDPTWKLHKVRQSGKKLMDIDAIKELMPCDEEALSRYRR